MIQRLGFPSLSFKANEIPSCRSAYSDRIASNQKVAQSQNDKSFSTSTPVNNTQIPMQGSTDKKLDVVV